MSNAYLYRLLIIGLAVTVIAASPAPHTLVAFLKQVHDDVGHITGSEVCVADSRTGLIDSLTNNGLGKFTPRWSPDGQQLAYLEDVSPNVRLPQVVVIGRKGEVRTIQRVFPDQVPGAQTRALVPRGISIVEWTHEDAIAIEGDLNPWVCMYMVMNTVTGAISQVQIGTCGTFQRSPDDLHVLAEQNVRRNVEPSTLSIDGRIFYPPAKSAPRILDSARWLPDGKTVAVLEHTADTGPRYLALVPLSGPARRIALPDSTGGPSSTVQWVAGDWIAIGGEIAINSSTGKVTRMPKDVSARMKSEMLAKDALEAIQVGAVAPLNLPVRSSVSDVWVAH
jgi:hypothetical protein